MITCIIFDTGNEKYREIHGNWPIGRTHPYKRKPLCRHLVLLFRERIMVTNVPAEKVTKICGILLPDAIILVNYNKKVI